MHHDLSILLTEFSGTSFADSIINDESLCAKLRKNGINTSAKIIKNLSTRLRKTLEGDGIFYVGQLAALGQNYLEERLSEKPNIGEQAFALVKTYLQHHGFDAEFLADHKKSLMVTEYEKIFKKMDDLYAGLTSEKIGYRTWQNARDAHLEYFETERPQLKATLIDILENHEDELLARLNNTYNENIRLVLSANDLTRTGLPLEFLQAAAGSETFQAAVLALLEGQARQIQRDAEGEELNNDPMS